MTSQLPERKEADSTRSVRARRERPYRDPIGRAMGGMVLILVGILYIVWQNGLFGVTWSNAWGAFLIGLGILLLLSSLARIAVHDHWGGVFGLAIGGLILIAVGTIPFAGADWARWWPLALVAIGVVTLIRQFTRG